jgi:hypothetical protein
MSVLWPEAASSSRVGPVLALRLPAYVYIDKNAVCTHTLPPIALLDRRRSLVEEQAAWPGQGQRPAEGANLRDLPVAVAA